MPEIERVSDNVLFGKYELGKLLGCGGFAKVYHARNISTGHSVAVKLINKKKMSGSSLMSNIKREITIMSRLSHPHIVKLYEVLATKTKIYFVMEFAKGGELFAKIAKGRFREDLSRRYFQQLIASVGYCHSHGVFHRDLKPENLLLDESGNLKVSDFGLSALTDQVHPDGLLHTLCGTPAYVAPEILGKRGYDGTKADVWSCGVILYVLSAGFLPFNDPNLMVMYKKIYRGEFRCPKWMSHDLKFLLSRLLDTNPDTRITIDEIMQNPWFAKGYKPITLQDLAMVESSAKEDEKSTADLNAFDIISFSSGLDLSGLFDASHSFAPAGELFVSTESSQRLIEAAEQIGKAESLTVRNTKKISGLALAMQGHNGEVEVEIELHRLNQNLTIVEGRRKGCDAETYRKIWTELRMRTPDS